MLNSNIIPITYVPGSGGVFLSNLLIFARFKLYHNFHFSNFGHAHYNNVWPVSSIDVHYIEDDPLCLIHQQMLTLKTSLKKPPYFLPYHISDAQLIRSHFAKNIRIVYEQSDVSEIALSYVGKWELDLQQSDVEEDTYAKIVKRTENYLTAFSIPQEVSSDTCYVSWKELTVNNPSDLIEKLHKFTDIPKENFLIKNISNWRQKTRWGIEKTKDWLNTKYNKEIVC